MKSRLLSRVGLVVAVLILSWSVSGSLEAPSDDQIGVPAASSALIPSVETGEVCAASFDADRRPENPVRVVEFFADLDQLLAGPEQLAFGPPCDEPCYSQYNQCINRGLPEAVCFGVFEGCRGRLCPSCP